MSHDRHNKTDTQIAAQEQKMQMAEAVAKVKAEILLYKHLIKEQTELKSKNEADIFNAENEMANTVEELIRDLREHENKLRGKFRNIYEAEQKQHITRLENLELITTQLKSFVERGQGILARDMSAEILHTNPAIIRRCDELLNVAKPDVYKSPYLYYSVDKKFVLLDQILVTKSEPSMCLGEGDDSKIGKESDFVVITKNLEGLQCYQENDQIKVVILTPEGDHLKTELNDSKDGKYIVKYTPQCVGQHTVKIQVNGQPLAGNPFVVQVRDKHQHRSVHRCHYRFASNFGFGGEEAEEFCFISDIAVSDKTGTIAVADLGDKRIRMYSSDGKFQRQIELNGRPISVAFTDSGEVLILISGNTNELCLFSEEDGFIKHINDKHLKPQHLSIRSDGSLIVAD